MKDKAASCVEYCQRSGRIEFPPAAWAAPSAFPSTTLSKKVNLLHMSTISNRITARVILLLTRAG